MWIPPEHMVWHATWRCCSFFWWYWESAAQVAGRWQTVKGFMSMNFVGSRTTRNFQSSFCSSLFLLFGKKEDKKKEKKKKKPLSNRLLQQPAATAARFMVLL
jgi:hypothetical protein